MAQQETLKKMASAPQVENVGAGHESTPSLWGVPLKYISLVTLAVQNATLALIMHYSRVSTSPKMTYSAAAAVLMNELLKGSISLVIAFTRVKAPTLPTSTSDTSPFWPRLKQLGQDIFSADCWKLSIPAILYVIQNNLQYVAASNLEAATFQVTYQMKILTTAFFSVLLLRKRLSSIKWLALCFLAVGVAVVQIQSTSGGDHASHVDQNMEPFKGFVAVAAACFTSGLAGVYFEMVLKNSQADLWVRNVQLSLFSLVPAIAPIVFARDATAGLNLFANFGAWAWATVLVQVCGGLLTALVIKYSDNILKGFATSLSIVISSLAAMAIFDFHVTFSFVLGSIIVILATTLYSQPDASTWTNGKNWRWMSRHRPVLSRSGSTLGQMHAMRLALSSTPSSAPSTRPSSPTDETKPMIFDYDQERGDEDQKGNLTTSVGRNLRTVAAQLGVGSIPLSRSSLSLGELQVAPQLPPSAQFSGLAAQKLPSRTHSQVPSRIQSQAPSRVHTPTSSPPSSPTT